MRISHPAYWFAGQLQAARYSYHKNGRQLFPYHKPEPECKKEKAPA